MRPRRTVTMLPFSPFKLILLLGWVYASLYLVKRVEDSPLVPNQYRSILHVVTLFFGPLVFLVLLLIGRSAVGAARDLLHAASAARQGHRQPHSASAAERAPRPTPRCGCSIRWAPN